MSILDKIKDMVTINQPTAPSSDIVKVEEAKTIKKTSQEKEEDISLRLKKCLIDFHKLMGKEYIIDNFDNFNLKNRFSELDLYDFEVMVETEFFDSLDFIPDGHLKTIPEYKEFLIKNT